MSSLFFREWVNLFCLIVELGIDGGNTFCYGWLSEGKVSSITKMRKVNTMTNFIKTFTVPLKKCKTTLEVDATKFTEEVHEYVYAMGLRQILNDAHSAFGNNPGKKNYTPDWLALSIAAAEKKLEAMLAGDIRTGGTGAVNENTLLTGLIYNRIKQLTNWTITVQKNFCKGKGISCEELFATICKKGGLDFDSEMEQFREVLKKKEETTLDDIKSLSLDDLGL